MTDTRVLPIPTKFAAALSHRIHTLLENIMGYSEMLADPALAPRSPQWVDAIDRIRQGNRELLDWVRLMLHFAGSDESPLSVLPGLEGPLSALALGEDDSPGPIGHAPAHGLSGGTKENSA